MRQGGKSMRPVIVPTCSACVGVIEVFEDRPMTKVGVYDIDYLQELVKVVEFLNGPRVPRIELAFTPMNENDRLNTLLARPFKVEGEGWVALAPIDPEGYPGPRIKEIRDDDEEDDDDIMEVD